MPAAHIFMTYAEMPVPISSAQITVPLTDTGENDEKYMDDRIAR